MMENTDMMKNIWWRYEEKHEEDIVKNTDPLSHQKVKRDKNEAWSSGQGFYKDRQMIV